MPRQVRDHPPRVLVVGAGPAGSAAALALCDLGLDVTLIERSVFGGRRAGEHLAPAALPALRRLGAEAVLDGVPRVACPKVLAAWEDDAPIGRPAIFTPGGEGRIVARPALDTALAAAAVARGARLITGTHLLDLRAEGAGWRATVRHPGGRQSLPVDFAIDASGRAAVVARALGHRPLVFDRLVGLIGTLENRAGDDGPAEIDGDDLATAAGGQSDSALLVEAAEDGWWYSTRLPDRRLLAAFMTDADLVRAAPGGPEALWRARWSQSRHTRRRGTSAPAPARVVVRAVPTQGLPAAAGPGWLAVGDAAVGFDPLSSAGLTKALADGPQAAAAIAAALAGSPERLDAYARDALAVLAAHLAGRQAIYGRVGRWADSAFWARRSPGDTPCVPLSPAPVPRSGVRRR